MAKHKTTKSSKKKVLTAAQLRNLRKLIADPAKRAIYIEMAEEGLLDLPTKPFDEVSSLRFKPIKVKGKPLSETIIEERR